MALLHENFESYAVGAFAITNFDNFFNQGLVAAGGMLPSSTRCFSHGNSYLRTSAGVLPSLSSFSVWWWLELGNATGGMPALTFSNSGAGYPSLLTVWLQGDNTLSLQVPGGAYIGHSAGPLETGANFLQCNVTFSTGLGGFLQVTAELAVNGVSLISGTLVSTFPVASLPGSLAQADTAIWIGPANFTAARIDELTVDVLTAISTFPNPGSPVARVTQGVIEPMELPDSGSVIISQGVIELILGAGKWRVYEA